MIVKLEKTRQGWIEIIIDGNKCITLCPDGDTFINCQAVMYKETAPEHIRNTRASWKDALNDERNSD